MTAKTIKDLFIHALSDIYSAEKQVTRALPETCARRHERRSERCLVLDFLCGADPAPSYAALEPR